MSVIQHQLALQVLELIREGNRAHRLLTYQSVAKALGRPTDSARAIAQVCDLLDAAAAISNIPLLALVAVRATSGEINPKAWVKDTPVGIREAIIQRSLTHSFIEEDFTAIEKSLGELSGYGNNAAWDEVRRRIPNLYEKLTSTAKDKEENRTSDAGKWPPAIRILPMANNFQEEFPGCGSIVDVQQKFFLNELAFRENGSYYYHKKGLQAELGTVVLFQCQAQIIASATLSGTQRFEESTEGDYEGCLSFDVATIRTFDPIKADTIQQIWPKFKGFNQVRWELDPKSYPEFERRLTHVKQPEMSIPTQEASDLISPAERVQENIYRILRDSELARRVKMLHDFKCQICGHTIKIPNGGSYAESHHIQPLGRPHNGPDTIGNIICVCPNHHAELDYGVAALSLPSLLHAAGHEIDQRYIEYHNKNVLKS